MQRFDDLIATIRAYTKEVHGGSKAALARAAGLSVNSLRDMDDPGWTPSGTTIRRLETVIPPDWKPEVSEDAA